MVHVSPNQLDLLKYKRQREQQRIRRDWIWISFFDCFLFFYVGSFLIFLFEVNFQKMCKCRPIYMIKLKKFKWIFFRKGIKIELSVSHRYNLIFDTTRLCSVSHWSSSHRYNLINCYLLSLLGCVNFYRLCKHSWDM